MDKNCIFCKIIAGQIPSEKLYEDADMLIIKDISPQAPVHLLMLTREHYTSVGDMTEAQALTLGRCIKKLADFAAQAGIESFRIISNKGADACQSVEHMHVHLLAGHKLGDKMG